MKLFLKPTAVTHAAGSSLRGAKAAVRQGTDMRSPLNRAGISAVMRTGDEAADDDTASKSTESSAPFRGVGFVSAAALAPRRVVPHHSHAVLLLLTLLVALLLTACGSTSSSSTSSSTATSSGSVDASTAATAASASPSLDGSAEASDPSPAASPTSTPAAKISGNLTVFAAASLTAAFTDIGKQIEQQNPGTKISFNFAGSPTLRTQLNQGAKADVFASADEPNMRGAQQDGTIASTPEIFVRNRLVLIVPKSDPAGITTLQDLAKPGIKLVLAQKDVPVGNYARQSFAKMDEAPSFGSGFSAKVLKNVVSEETNVKQVVAKVQLGEADAGIVYTTDVTPSVRPDVKMIEIPDQFNIIASYPAAVVKGSSNPKSAAAFIDYLRSPAGQAILQHYGFLPPTAS